MQYNYSDPARSPFFRPPGRHQVSLSPTEPSTDRLRPTLRTLRKASSRTSAPSSLPPAPYRATSVSYRSPCTPTRRPRQVRRTLLHTGGRFRSPSEIIRLQSETYSSYGGSGNFSRGDNNRTPRYSTLLVLSIPLFLAAKFSPASYRRFASRPFPEYQTHRRFCP